MTVERRETRMQRAERLAREDFRRHRRSADHFQRWLSWLWLRAILEGWDGADPNLTGAYVILEQAEAWRRGFRPPTSLHEAAAQIRRRHATGTLYEPGDGR